MCMPLTAFEEWQSTNVPVKYNKYSNFDPTIFTSSLKHHAFLHGLEQGNQHMCVLL